MFDWLSDFFGGVGTAFSDAFEGLGQSISNAIWETMLQWFYTAIYDAIAQFFTSMGNLGAEMYDLAWVKAAIHLFYLFGWALFLVGMVTAIFDVAIESQSGRVNIKPTALNVLKGFMAASLITVVPLELYKFCITLQNTFAGDLTRVFAGEQTTGLSGTSMSVLAGSFAVSAQINITLFNLLAMIAMLSRYFFRI